MSTVITSKTKDTAELYMPEYVHKLCLLYHILEKISSTAKEKLSLNPTIKLFTHENVAVNQKYFDT